MGTMEQCIEMDRVYRKYRKGKPVEREDIRTVERLCDSRLLEVYFENGEPYAVAKSRKSTW